MFKSVLAFLWSIYFPPKARPSPGDIAPSAASLAARHEVSDASPRTIGLLVLGLFAVIFIALGALGLMYQSMYADTAAIPVPPSQASFKSAPQKMTSIAKDWIAIDRLTHQRLEKYGWSDRAHGVARIPIARAMALIASEGLPARNGQPPAFPPPEQEKLPLLEMQSTTDATKIDPP